MEASLWNAPINCTWINILGPATLLVCFWIFCQHQVFCHYHNFKNANFVYNEANSPFFLFSFSENLMTYSVFVFLTTWDICFSFPLKLSPSVTCSSLRLPNTTWLCVPKPRPECGLRRGRWRISDLPARGYGQWGARVPGRKRGFLWVRLEWRERGTPRQDRLMRGKERKEEERRSRRRKRRWHKRTDSQRLSLNVLLLKTKNIWDEIQQIYECLKW